MDQFHDNKRNNSLLRHSPMAWRQPANRRPEALSPGTATSSSIPTTKRDNKSNLRFAGIFRFWRGQCGASSSRGSRRVYRESDEPVESLKCVGAGKFPRHARRRRASTKQIEDERSAL